MTTLSITSLNQIIEEKNTAKISGTNLSGGMMINGNPLNFPISEALHTLSMNDITFSKAEVYLEEVMEDEEGFLFTMEDMEIFILWDSGKKVISEIIFNDSFSKYARIDAEISLLQSILLLEIELNITDSHIRELLVPLKNKVIESETTESADFAKIVRTLEVAIQEKQLEIKEFSESEFTVNKKVLLLEDVLVNEVLTVEEPLEKEEIVDAVVNTMEPEMLLIQEDDVINGVPIKQITLFGEEEEVLPVVKKNKNKTTKTPKSKEMPAAKVKPVVTVTLEDVRNYSELIFDDVKAKEKLVALGFETRIVNAAIEFRKIQREKVLKPESMLLIPNKMTYVGWSEPVEDTVVALLTKNHILIKAEAGTGKSTMVRTVCALLNYPMYYIGGSVDADIETFLGFKTLEDGNVEFIDGPVVKAIRDGGLIYLDEGNSVMESVLIKLHSVLDDQGEIFVEASGEVYKVHPNTRFITTVNEGYAGTREFNDATADRMVGIEMDYMSSDHLWGLLENFDGGFTEYQRDILKMGRISKGDLIILTEIAKALQFAAKEGILEAKVASTRNIIALMKTTRLYSFKKAIRFILKKYSKEDQPAIASVLENVEDLGLTATEMLSL